MHKIRVITALTALAAAAILSTFAQADTGLAQRCDSATTATQAAACTGSRTWMHPTVTDAGFYLSYTSLPADSTTVSWSDPALQFRSYQSILSSNPGTYGVMVCTKDLPVPSVIAVTDACAPGNDKVAKVFVASSSVALANVSVPPPPSGTGTAKLTWVAPKTNTDGSALTDLVGFNVYQGPSSDALVGLTALPLAASTLNYTVTGLAPGTYVFAVTAINAAGIESAQAVSSPSTITKQTVPGPPSKVVVTVTVSVP